MESPAQNIIQDENGNLKIEGDWFGGILPGNITLAPFSYPDTAYSFSKYHSENAGCFELGFASGNYGHSNFIGGKNAKIKIGRFVVLQGMNMICNDSITIGDHCMFSWGSMVTDSWIAAGKDFLMQRRNILTEAAKTSARHADFSFTSPVTIEENVWVGFKAIILPGVTVGRGSIIGSNALITEDVPPYSVVAGNPSRIIRQLQPTDTLKAKEKIFNDFSIRF